MKFFLSILTLVVCGIPLFVYLGGDLASVVEGEPQYRDDMTTWERKAVLETPIRMCQIKWARNSVSNWPPQEGRKFPDVDLIDHHGRPFSIHSLAGKPVLVEFIAMSCAGCQAFSGGNRFGPFEKFASQKGLLSLEAYFERYTGHSMSTDRINVVQVVVYDLKLTHPNADDLAKWRTHFRLTSPNMHVVGGTKALANSASFKMIPGFMLLDSDLNILLDSTGHSPKRDLYRDVLPKMKEMLR